MTTAFLNRARRAFLAAKNEPDEIKLDVPTFIRLLEFAREDAKTDMDLHFLTENVIKKSTEGKTITMADYDSLLPSSK